jgi:hypothetical protein
VGLEVGDDIHATTPSDNRIKESTRGATHYNVSKNGDDGVIVHWNSKTESHILHSHDMLSVTEFIYDTFSCDYTAHEINCCTEYKRDCIQM